MDQPDLTDPDVIAHLAPRPSAYWNTLEYCRHIGLHKPTPDACFWVARIRTRTGRYRQARLGEYRHHGGGVTHEQAVELAEAWFASPETSAIASDPYPVGVTRQLRYRKITEAFTVGDAMLDYVEWKRIAATRSHFETNLSLINFHIIPRLGDVPLDAFNGRHFTEFCRDVLETPPKRGNQALGDRMAISSLDPEALRKRKKTLNTLIGILRLALRLAWENGETDSERAWRCLRRVPSVDVPRQHFLTRHQCRRLIASCRPDLADLVRAALYSGCRVSELQRLRVRDIGRDIFGLFVQPSKNGRGRHIFLPEEGMTFFLDRCQGRPEDELVFRMRGGRAWNGGHKHLFREAVQNAKLPDGFVFHGLRHTYASQLVQAGAPLAMVARQLGHSNTDTVSRTYGHLSCTSIEAELQLRFAAIEPTEQRDRSRLERLRRSLQADWESSENQRHWPTSNFSTADGSSLRLISQTTKQ